MAHTQNRESVMDTRGIKLSFGLSSVHGQDSAFDVSVEAPNHKDLNLGSGSKLKPNSWRLNTIDLETIGVKLIHSSHRNGDFRQHPTVPCSRYILRADKASGSNTRKISMDKGVGIHAFCAVETKTSTHYDLLLGRVFGSIGNSFSCALGRELISITSGRS